MQLIEYRICLPFSVEEYKRAQLYMIARHCHQESEKGEGVEVVKYEKCEDNIHGIGHYTEKRIHLYNKLPTWVQSFIPNLFYIEEKSWNYFPYTITEYSCSFFPKYTIHTVTRYEDMNNNGEIENTHNLTVEELNIRTIDRVDIVTDAVPEHRYKDSEDPNKIEILKTNPHRGPLQKETWKNDCIDRKIPIMCIYKIVRVKFEVWGLQTRVEGWTHKTIRDILVIAHRQVFCWCDEWYDKNYESIVKYEQETYAKTNSKVLLNNNSNISNQTLDNDKDLADFS